MMKREDIESPRTCRFVRQVAVACGCGRHLAAGGFRVGPVTVIRRVILTVLLIAPVTGRAEAFQQVQQMIQELTAKRVERAPADGMRLTPIVDRDAEAWLNRGAEAAERGDWKLAADTLSRVIDEYGDRTISVDDGRRFISAARAARYAIAAWPPEGIEAYRLLYDAEARQMFEQAKADHDMDGLRRIARRFALTSVGPEAIDLLIDWLIDAGQGAESIDHLQQLGELRAGRASWKQKLRLVIALTLSEQPQRAREIIAELRTLKGQPDAPTQEGLPDDWAKRVESVAQFVEASATPESGGLQSPVGPSWPQMLGAPSTGGRMSAINPAVTPEDAWRDSLPGTQRLNISAVHQLTVMTGRPPVWQCVSDGRNLFCSGPEGVMARDLATFDLLWRSVPKSSPRDPALTQFRVNVGMTEANNDDRLDELTTISLFHDYRGALSCGLGMVFAVEQFGTVNERFPTRQGVADPNDSFTVTTQTEANSIRAFEADTGRAAWTRGRGGPPDDEFKFAHFYGPPIVSEDRLLAVCQVGEDLNLAVFSAGGKLLRKTLLGSGRAGMFPINGVLQPTVHDGTVFVPTGAGVLIALNSFDYSLRWLAAYDRHESTGMSRRRGAPAVFVAGRAFTQPDEWISSPPVAAGGFVILAPHDSDKVMAFDRQTGVAAWQRDRGRSRYIIGADARRVLLGGQDIVSVDTATGEEQWTQSGVTPTGRAIYCGEQVLVPTGMGLTRLSVADGQVQEPTLYSRDPMGNLFAIDGALYSLSAESISKYADLEQTRGAAKLALERDPNDLSAVLRLGWLATMERRWNEALELLDRADRLCTRENADEIGARIAHQRVKILLSLAAEADLEHRAEFIVRAAKVARRADDRVRAGLAHCDLLIEQGSAESAILNVLDLARNDGDEPVSLEAQLDARATVMIRDRIVRAWRKASESTRAEVAAEIRERVDGALVDGRISDAVRMGDALDLFADEDVDSDLRDVVASLKTRLGSYFHAQGDPESAIYYWELAYRPTGSAEADPTAALLLARTYLESGDGIAGSPADALRVLRSISPDWGDRRLPEQATKAGFDSDLATVGEAVSSLERRLPAGLLESDHHLPRILSEASSLAIQRQDDVPMSIGLRDTVSFLDFTAPPDVFAEVMPIVKLSQVLGIRTSGDSPDMTVWSNDLGPIVEDQGAVLRDWMMLNTRPAAVAGRVGVLAAGARICAIGLMTGRMMWPSIYIEGDGGDLPQPPMVHVAGMVIVATHANTLVGIPARQGAHPAWRRQFPGNPLGRLDTVGNRLVVTDASAESMVVLHPTSGRVQRKFSLLVPSTKRVKEIQVQEALRDILKNAAGVTGVDEGALDTEASFNHVGITGGVVCRSGESRVVGRDVLTGRTLWELPFTDLITGILRLDDSHFGICRGRHRIAVVSSATGSIVKDIHVPGLQIPPLDAVLDPPPSSLPSGGNRLLMYTRTSNDPVRYVLTSYPMKEGDLPWQQELGPLATVSHRMMRASPDYIAAVAYEFPPERDRMQRPFLARGLPTLASARLFIFDKGGERRLIESPFAFPILSKPDDRWYTGLIADVAIFDNRIVAVGPDGYYVLGVEEARTALDSQRRK